MRNSESKQTRPVVNIQRERSVTVPSPINTTTTGANTDTTIKNSMPYMLARLNLGDDDCGAADSKVRSKDSPIDQGRRLRTGSRDHPDEMPLPLRVDAKDTEAVSSRRSF
jgi:hypothetical protein